MVTKISAEQVKQANQLLGRLDKLAGDIQENYKKMGFSFEAARQIVNELDKVADGLEKFAFGEDSLAVRQVELLKQAKVIKSDPDEGYMGTFNSPSKLHQSEADEPYMSAFSDDDTFGVHVDR